MAKVATKLSIFLNTITAALLCVLSLYYFNGKDFVLNKVTMDIYLTSDNFSKMKIYTADSTGHYREDLTRSVNYNHGNSGHSLGFAIKNHQAQIRLDPTTRNGNTVTITKIVFTHIGLTKTISGLGFNRYLSECVNAQCTVDQKGVHSIATSNDPQIYLKPTMVPLVKPLHVVLLLSVIFALVFGLLTLIEWFVIQQKQARTLVVAGIVIILASLLWFPASTLYLLVAFFIIYARFFLAANAYQPVAVSSIYLRLVLFISVAFYASWCLLSLLQMPSWEKLKKDFSASEQPLTTTISGLIHNSLYKKQQLLNSDAEFKVYKLRMTPNPKTIIGQDDWFFEGYGERKVEAGITQNFDNVADLLGLAPFSEDDLQQWQQILEDRYYWLKERGVHYVFAIAPVKAEVYSEYLPERLIDYKAKLQKPSRYDQLVRYLADHSDVPLVELRTPLLNAKSVSNEPLYYRTDFHWNYLGALYAYSSIFDALKLEHAQLAGNKLNIRDFRIKKREHWAHPVFLTLAGLDPARHQDDTNICMVPKDEKLYANHPDINQYGICATTLSEYSKVRLSGDRTEFIAQIDNKNANADNLLIIGDSFAEVFSYYLSHHFDNTYTARSIVSFPTVVINKLKPDVIVQEMLSMYLLTEVATNPAHIEGAKERYLARH